MKKQEVTSDVLVIGGGMAGAAAAVKAAGYGCRVALLDKGVLGRSGSSPVSGGSVAFPSSGPGTIESGDSLQSFYEDIIASGEGISNPRLVSCLVEESACRVADLETMGIVFQHNAAGLYNHREGGGNSFPRRCSAVGGGAGLMLGLRKEVLHRGVRVFEDMMAFKILKKNGAVNGVAALHQPTGSLYIFRAAAVVLSAGSATGLYPFASSSFTSTGDSFAIALDAGAELANMEFTEYFFIPAPKGIPVPAGGRDYFTSAGAVYYNALGERFMTRYDPARLDKSSKKTIVQAMEREIREGRGPVTMDATVVDPERRPAIEKSPLFKKIMAAGIDPWQERFAWQTSVHSILGGIVITPAAATSVPGLYACGEASTGIHGANRLAGVALAECAVFGCRAGKQAALYAAEAGPASDKGGDIDLHYNPGQPAGKTNDLPDLRNEIRTLAWDNAGIIRSGSRLKQALERFNRILEELQGQPPAGSALELAQVHELRHLAMTGAACTQAALLREESRGEHLREDFPDKNDGKWRDKETLTRLVNGRLQSLVQSK